jgi:hypothetical protein
VGHVAVGDVDDSPFGYICSVMFSCLFWPALWMAGIFGHAALVTGNNGMATTSTTHTIYVIHTTQHGAGFS